MDSSSYLKKAQNFTINKDGLLGKVLVGNVNQPICVPGISALTILGRLGKNTKVPSGTPCLIDTAAMNHCLVHPRGKTVLVILMNQNNHYLDQAATTGSRNVFGRTSSMGLWGWISTSEE